MRPYERPRGACYGRGVSFFGCAPSVSAETPGAVLPKEEKPDTPASGDIPVGAPAAESRKSSTRLDDDDEEYEYDDDEGQTETEDEDEIQKNHDAFIKLIESKGWTVQGMTSEASTGGGVV